MPPVTRKAKNSVVTRKPSSPASGTAPLFTFTQNASIGTSELPQTLNGSQSLLSDISNDPSGSRDSLAVFNPTIPSQNVHDTLHPLREMAERVGREVETFAENLDTFFDRLRPMQSSSASSGSEVAPETFSIITGLIGEFRNLADEAARNIERSHRQERAAQLRSEWAKDIKIDDAGSKDASGAGVVSTQKDDQVEVLRAWQEEADFWDLFNIVLGSKYKPGHGEDTRETEEEPASRYSDESELWRTFIRTDDSAREKSLIKEWLERTANHQNCDLKGITDELEDRGGRGKGLWTHGWMHTREKIKGEKRLKPWPSSEDAPLPQIKRSDNHELLVTALDPDSVMRQDRTLEKPDTYFERAIWIVCWEMLRRGQSWEEVSRWCEERKEGWRAVSLGTSSSSSQATSTVLWRNMCYEASQSECSNEYEAAVYGLIGGNEKAVRRVCRNVDDRLYAYISTSLTLEFDQYISAKFPEQKFKLKRRTVGDAPEDPQRLWAEILAKLRTQSITTVESIQPFKIIISYLLANDLDNLIKSLGHALAFADFPVLGQESLIDPLEKFWTQEGNLPEAEVVLNAQTLRVATHISIIIDQLPGKHLADDRRPVENLIVAYIQKLRAAGKRDLIPLYAARLSPSKWTVVMSRIMQDITDVKEQQEILNLMQMSRSKYNTMDALNESLRFCLATSLGQSAPKEKPLRMLESAEDKKLYPGQRIIAGFLPDHTTESDDLIVRSLQWFNLLNGHWHETFVALTKALRKCLVAGRIACALKIVREFPYENISIRKSFQTIGKSVNMMDHDGPAPADERQKWEVMTRQSRTYFELGLLVSAIEALANWRELEQKHTGRRPKLPSAPAELKEAKTAVDEAMLPVLSGILQSPYDEEEDCELVIIRKSYIPEVVIAYNTVLHTAGSVITRNALVESMDLSITVADDDNRLSECFIQAGRMRELVTSFAYTSKAMLVLKAEGAKWNPKKEREGKDLGMWEIGPQSTHSIGGREVAHVSLD